MTVGLSDLAQRLKAIPDTYNRDIRSLGYAADLTQFFLTAILDDPRWTEAACQTVLHQLQSEIGYRVRRGAWHQGAWTEEDHR